MNTALWRPALQSYSPSYRKSNSAVVTSASGHEVKLLSKGLVSNSVAPFAIAVARLSLVIKPCPRRGAGTASNRREFAGCCGAEGSLGEEEKDCLSFRSHAVR